MLFNSTAFLIFLPVVLLVHFIIPERFRYLWLLAASYYFYMSWNPRYGLLILTSTVVTYLCALVIGAYEERKMRLQMLILCLVINLGLLFYFKYFGLASDFARRILAFLHI